MIQLTTNNAVLVIPQHDLNKYVALSISIFNQVYWNVLVYSNPHVWTKQEIFLSQEHIVFADTF